MCWLRRTAIIIGVVAGCFILLLAMPISNLFFWAAMLAVLALAYSPNARTRAERFVGRLGRLLGRVRAVAHASAPRRKLLRWTRWYSAVLCFLSLLGFGISSRYVLGPRVRIGSTIGEAFLYENSLLVGWLDGRHFTAGSGLQMGWFCRNDGHLTHDPLRSLSWRTGRTPAGALCIVEVNVPWWEICCVLALLTAGLFWLDRRPADTGQCTRCLYDLTGNISGVCPECGERL